MWPPRISSLMHEVLTGLLEKAELAVATSRSVVEPSTLDPIAKVIAEARLRMLYPEEVMVVALVGGTGSGKSSLFNLLTGTEAADVGVVRPTTSEALAGVPSEYARAMEGFLEALGIERRVTQDRLAGVCLLDLPDTDSVETDHRLQVESLLPRLDVMVWVVDPEKYRDSALHHRYLQPLSAYTSQFVVVLNQIDRLPVEAVDQVVDDLVAALDEDGLSGVPVISVSASPPAGPPRGVDDLAGTIATMAGTRDLLFTKLFTDLAHAASDLTRAIGGPLGYLEDVEQVVSRASEQLTAGERGGAVDTLVEFVAGLAEAVEGPISSSLDKLAASLPEKMQAIEVPTPEVKKWWRRTGTSDPATVEKLASDVSALLAPARDLLTMRARAAATATEFSLAVGRVHNLSDK